MRVASWNIDRRGRRPSPRLGVLVRERGVDLLLVQEATRAALEKLVEGAELDWVVTPFDGGNPGSGGDQQAVAAIAGRGQQPTDVGRLRGPCLPQRMVHATVDLGLGSFTAASYCAPRGAHKGYGKAEHARALLEWVNSVQGPLIMGADANTPEVDHPDPRRVRTHLHTGDLRLHGAPGDDTMFGGRPEHSLSDAYRRWLQQNPGILQATATDRPDGPLAVSYVSRRRRYSEDQAWRFDAIWVSREFTVENVEYDYNAAVTVGAEHALVIADVQCGQFVL